MHGLFAVTSLLVVTSALPQRNRNGGGRGGGRQQTAQQQAAQVPQGISQAQDGSMILDDTVMVKYDTIHHFLNSLIPPKKVNNH